jgi:hypothetical protein
MSTEFCRNCKQSHLGRVCDYDDQGECAETVPQPGTPTANSAPGEGGFRPAPAGYRPRLKPAGFPFPYGRWDATSAGRYRTKLPQVRLPALRSKRVAAS